MNDVIAIVLPFASVLLGAGITYLVGVRTRRRTKVEEIYHDALAAVAVAVASHDFIASLEPWRGATPEETQAVNAQLAREGNLRFVEAVADARSALARASVYDQRLTEFIQPRSGGGRAIIYVRGDEIMRLLRTNIETGRL